MPHFNEEGHDTYLCQVCAEVKDGEKFPASWRPDLTGYDNAGCICPECLAARTQTIPVMRTMDRVLQERVRISFAGPVLATPTRR